MKKFLSFLTAILLCASATLASACQFNDSSNSSSLEASSSSPISSVEESSSSLPEIIEPCQEHTFGDWETIQEYACGTSTQRICTICETVEMNTITTEEQFLTHTFDDNTLCTTCGHQEFIESEEYITVDDQSNGNFTHIFYTWWSHDKSYALEIINTNFGATSPFISSYLGTPVNVIIPTSIMGTPITAIGGDYGYGSHVNPFINCKTLESIIIPYGITSLPITFKGCTKLREIIIENPLLDFNKNTFLDTEFWHNQKENIIYLNNVCLGYTNTGSSEVIIKEGTIRIANFAFDNSSFLSKIIIPNSVAHIEYKAFSDCISLTEIRIPNSVSYLDGYIFENCTSLKKVYVSKNCSINSRAFINCHPNLEIIYYD